MNLCLRVCRWYAEHCDWIFSKAYLFKDDAVLKPAPARISLQRLARRGGCTVLDGYTGYNDDAVPTIR